MSKQAINEDELKLIHTRHIEKMFGCGLVFYKTA